MTHDIRAAMRYIETGATNGDQLILNLWDGGTDMPAYLRTTTGS